MPIIGKRSHSEIWPRTEEKHVFNIEISLERFAKNFIWGYWKESKYRPIIAGEVFSLPIYHHAEMHVARVWVKEL